MVEVVGSPMLAAADAVTILEQIEGAMAYLDTVGTRADDLTYKRMRLVLEAAHRARLCNLGLDIRNPRLYIACVSGSG